MSLKMSVFVIVRMRTVTMMLSGSCYVFEEVRIDIGVDFHEESTSMQKEYTRPY